MTGIYPLLTTKYSRKERKALRLFEKQLLKGMIPMKCEQCKGKGVIKQQDKTGVTHMIRCPRCAGKGTIIQVMCKTCGNLHICPFSYPTVSGCNHYRAATNEDWFYGLNTREKSKALTTIIAVFVSDAMRKLTDEPVNIDEAAIRKVVFHWMKEAHDFETDYT